MTTLNSRDPAVIKYFPKLTATPFEYAFALLIMADMVSSGYQIVKLGPELPRVGLYSVPSFVLWSWLLFGFLGASGILAGLVWGIFDSRARSLEVAGLWLSASVWVSVLTASIIATPVQWYMWVQFIPLIIGIGLRLAGLSSYEHTVERLMSDFEGTKPDDVSDGS